MNNELIAKLGFSDVYRAFVLSLTTDKVTNTTDTTIQQLADFCKEKKGAYEGNSKSKSFIETLRATGLIKIESFRSQSFSNVNSVSRNRYTFLIGDSFRMIYTDLVNIVLDIKLKGYLINLCSLS